MKKKSHSQIAYRVSGTLNGLVRRGDIKRFRQHLNSQDVGDSKKHRHLNYRQRTRLYGDYLYHQDRERFMVEMAEWLTANIAVSGGLPATGKTYTGRAGST